MTTALDLIYALLVAAAFPLLDQWLLLPGFRQRAPHGAERARSWFWNLTLASLWIVTALGVGLWLGQARPWARLGFTVPAGWRAGTAAGLCAAFVVQGSLTIRKVARSDQARASVRKQFGDLGVAGSLMPATNFEFGRWVVLSLSAGFCEEFLFRGYLIWVLAPSAGWWGAAVISLFFFAIAHAYQGKRGVITSGAMGLVLTATVALFQSLLPAMVLHALVDLCSGSIAWLAFRSSGQRSAQSV